MTHRYFSSIPLPIIKNRKENSLNRSSTLNKDGKIKLEFSKESHYQFIAIWICFRQLYTIEMK